MPNPNKLTLISLHTPDYLALSFTLLVIIRLHSSSGSWEQRIVDGITGEVEDITRLKIQTVDIKSH